MIHSSHRRGAKHSFVFVRDDSVTFTRPFLESGPVEDTDSAAPGSNQACILQRPEDLRHARPPSAKHDRQELVRELDVVGADPVPRHKQPPAAALLESMQSIASNRL